MSDLTTERIAEMLEDAAKSIDWPWEVAEMKKAAAWLRRLKRLQPHSMSEVRRLSMQTEFYALTDEGEGGEG